MQEQSNLDQAQRRALYQYIYRCYSPKVLEKARVHKGSDDEVEAYAAFLLEKIYQLYCNRINFDQLDDEAVHIVDENDGSYEAISYFTEEMRRELRKGAEPSLAEEAMAPWKNTTPESIAETDEMLDAFLLSLDAERDKLTQPVGLGAAATYAIAAQDQAHYERPEPLAETPRRVSSLAEAAIREKHQAPAEEEPTAPAPQLASELYAAPIAVPLTAVEQSAEQPEQPKEKPLEKQPEPEALQENTQADDLQAEVAAVASKTKKPKKKRKRRLVLDIILIIVLLILMWAGYGMMVSKNLIPGVDFGYSWFNQNIFPLF